MQSQKPIFHVFENNGQSREVFVVSFGATISTVFPYIYIKEIRVKELTLSEIIFLLAIWRLEDNAYGVTIRKQIAKVTSKTYTYGTLYSALDQLFKKGYVIKSAGPSTPERGGRSKIYYKLTKEGLKALKASRELQKTIWRGIPELTFNKV
jgi:PadR family transcriptional regulator PadR